MEYTFLSATILLILITDPLGNIPLFISCLRGVSPKRTVFEGGPGAWEALLRVSYTDLTDGGVEGGTFWRITPMLNWHLIDGIRLELAYGYGVLDRFGKEGATQFLQTRLQAEF